MVGFFFVWFGFLLLVVGFVFLCVWGGGGIVLVLIFFLPGDSNFLDSWMKMDTWTVCLGFPRSAHQVRDTIYVEWK